MLYRAALSSTSSVQFDSADSETSSRASPSGEVEEEERSSRTASALRVYIPCPPVESRFANAEKECRGGAHARVVVIYVIKIAPENFSFFFFCSLSLVSAIRVLSRPAGEIFDAH